MRRVRQPDDNGANGVKTVEVAVDSAVVGLLPLDVSTRVEFEKQGAGRVFLRKRSWRFAAPVASDEIAAIGGWHAAERVFVAVWRASVVEIVERLLPPQLALPVELRH